LTKMFFDVHLMCSKPEILLEPFAKAGADGITIHVELSDRVTPLLWKIRSLGLKVGLAVNPPTTIASAEPYLSQIDLLLVMTVNPGFGGQKFIPYTVEKIRRARQIIDQRNYSCVIEVDGGIDSATVPTVVKAGADILVVGSAIFHAPEPGQKVKELLEIAASVGYDRGYV